MHQTSKLRSVTTVEAKAIQGGCHCPDGWTPVAHGICIPNDFMAEPKPDHIPLVQVAAFKRA